MNLHNLALIAPSVMRVGMASLRWQADHTFMIYGDQDELVSPEHLAQFAEERGNSHYRAFNRTFFPWQIG